MKFFHKHDWKLIDKTVIAPNKRISEASGLRQQTVQRLALGYVVLTFKCECGDVKVVDR